MHAQIYLLIKFIFLLKLLFIQKNLPIDFMHKRCAFQVVGVIKFTSHLIIQITNYDVINGIFSTNLIIQKLLR